MEDPDCPTLLRYFDELHETKDRVPTKTFQAHLEKWGLSSQRAKEYMRMFDPERTGYVTRERLCLSLNCYPNIPEYARDACIVDCDMSQHKRESVIKVVIDEMRKPTETKDKLYRVKHRLERLYGMDWNIYRAEGVLYSFIQSKPGSHLCFVHNGVTYGVFQTPTSNTKSSDH